MKKIFIIIFLLLFSSISLASDKWTTQDTILQGIYGSLIAIDLWQTYNGSVKSEDYRESNPLMPGRPSMKKIVAYASAGFVAHTFITYLLPKPYRTNWQSFTIGIETCIIYRNYINGIRVGISNKF